MCATPLEASIARALDDAYCDDSIVADLIELTGRSPMSGLDLGTSEE